MSNPNAARLGDDIIHTSILADILGGVFEAAICVAVGVVVVAAAAPLAAAAATAAGVSAAAVAAAGGARWSGGSNLALVGAALVGARGHRLNHLVEVLVPEAALVLGARRLPHGHDDLLDGAERLVFGD